MLAILSAGGFNWLVWTILLRRQDGTLSRQQNRWCNVTTLAVVALVLLSFVAHPDVLIAVRGH